MYEGLLHSKSRTEDVAFRRTAAWVPADRILQIVSKNRGVERASLLRRRRDSLDRAIASRMLCDFAGLTQRQAADVLGLRCGAAVSAHLQKLSEQLNADPRLRKQVVAIAAQLQAARP
jgi:hypothetical protein